MLTQHDWLLMRNVFTLLFVMVFVLITTVPDNLPRLLKPVTNIFSFVCHFYEVKCPSHCIMSL